MLDFFDSLTMYGKFEYVTSLVFVLLALWGVIHFFPDKDERGDNGPAWLILAIFLGFLGNGISTLVWVVLGDPLVFYGIMSEAGKEFAGSLLGNILGKGLAAISVYLHFYARWKALPDEEKPAWTPLLMGYYPDKTGLAYKTLMLLLFRWHNVRDQ